MFVWKGSRRGRKNRIDFLRNQRVFQLSMVTEIIVHIRLNIQDCFFFSIWPLYHHRIYWKRRQPNMKWPLHRTLETMHWVIFEFNYSFLSICANHCANGSTITTIALQANIDPITSISIFNKHIAEYFCGGIQMINYKVKVTVIV